MENKQIKELMSAMEKTGTKRLVLKKEEVELTLEREDGPSKQFAEHVIEFAQKNPMLQELEEHRLNASPSRYGKESRGILEEEADDPKQTVDSPMVGTFYATPSPEVDPFVKVGDLVEKDTIVCIIEAMKVMNEVKAEVTGKITEVFVKSGDPVEFGTPLFSVD